MARSSIPTRSPVKVSARCRLPRWPKTPSALQNARGGRNQARLLGEASVNVQRCLDCACSALIHPPPATEPLLSLAVDEEHGQLIEAEHADLANIVPAHQSPAAQPPRVSVDARGLGSLHGLAHAPAHQVLLVTWTLMWTDINSEC